MLRMSTNRNGPVSVLGQPAIPRSQYQQDLENGVQSPYLSTATVKHWSDFSRVFYHPNSIQQVNELGFQSNSTPLRAWNDGEELFNTLDRGLGLFDQDFRFFLEGCDLLQGIQIVTGTDDCWGGFASRYLDVLRDELGKGSIWIWGLESAPPSSRVG